MTRRLVLACVVLLVAANGLAGRAQPTRPARELFSPEVAAPSPRALPATGVVTRSRTARIVSDLQGADATILNLFDDVSIEAHRTDVAGVRSDNVWFGRVGGDPLSAVTFVWSDGLLQGSIRTARGTFSVEPIAGGPDHVIRQVDLRSAPPELPPLAPPLPEPRADSTPALDDAPYEPHVFDLLVLYTVGARQQAGGDDAAVRARIALGIAETNLAYANSGVPHRVQLAGTELVGYVEGADIIDDLQRLTSPADGVMDIVHARRSAVGADLVMLIVDATDGAACGVAWVMHNLSIDFAPYAFSVVAYPCISPNYTFAHELAHNMGSAHAPDDPNAPPVFPYSFGYKDPARQFRTIMSYDCPGGCPRILYFSNPAVTYAGKPTGTPEQQDNALSITQTGSTVARFTPARAESDRLSAPRMLAVESLGRRVTLNWAVPEQGSPLGCAIEVGSAEGFSTIATLVVNGGGPSSFVQPVVPPGTYLARVRAFDRSGPGAPSPAVRLVMTDLGRCVAPAGAPELLPAAITGSTVTINWRAPLDGGAVERYVIGAGTRSQTANLGVVQTSPMATTFTAAASAGVYFVRVAGLNGCGIGIPSNEIAFVVGPPVPGPPVGVTATTAPGRRVTVSWEPPSAGGPPAYYVVEGGSATGLANVGLLPTDRAVQSLTVVSPPGRYFVRVRAINDYGSSVASEEIVVEVP